MLYGGSVAGNYLDANTTLNVTMHSRYLNFVREKGAII